MTCPLRPCRGYEREDAMEIINLGAGDGLPPVDWAAVTEKLDAGSAPAPDADNSRTTWLATLNEDGSPHVTVRPSWLDGAFWFQTGSGTRKGRNVVREPCCSIAVSIRDADVVIEGDAARVSDPTIVARNRRARRGRTTVGQRSPTRAVPASPPAVQRTVARTTAVARVSRRATLGDCRVGHRAGRPNSLQILTLGRNGAGRVMLSRASG